MASEKAKFELEEQRMTHSSSFHSLGAPPPYESVVSSPTPTSLSGNLMRAFYVYGDWRGNLTIYQDPQKLRPVYRVKNQFTFFSNRPDVVLFRADESLVGCCMIRHSLFSKCRMECYVDEACAQLLTTVQREGLGGKYAFELLRSDGVKRYLWNPTTFLAVGKSYELLDVDNAGRPIATFDNATFSMSKCGTLYIQHDLNDFLTETIVMTWAALREKRRRDDQRAAASSSSAAAS